MFGSCVALSAHVWIPTSHRLPSHAGLTFGCCVFVRLGICCIECTASDPLRDWAVTSRPSDGMGEAA